MAVLGLTIGVLSTISFEDGAGPFFVVFLVAMGLFLSTGVAGPDGPGRPAVVAGLSWSRWCSSCRGCPCPTRRSAPD